MTLTQTFKTFLQFTLAPKRPVYKNLLDLKYIKVNIQKNITDFKVSKNTKIHKNWIMHYVQSKNIKLEKFLLW